MAYRMNCEQILNLIEINSKLFSYRTAYKSAPPDGGALRQIKVCEMCAGKNYFVPSYRSTSLDR